MVSYRARNLTVLFSLRSFVDIGNDNQVVSVGNVCNLWGVITAGSAICELSAVKEEDVVLELKLSGFGMKTQRKRDSEKFIDCNCVCLNVLGTFTRRRFRIEWQS